MVRSALSHTSVIACPADGPPVCRTVAAALRESVAQQAKLVASPQPSDLPDSGLLRIGLADGGFARGPETVPADGEWMYFRLDANGNGELVASKPSLLYALFCQIRDEWLSERVAAFAGGRLLKASLSWLTGRDDFATGRTDFISKRGGSVGSDDVEGAMRELARLGCSHVVANELGHCFPHESGPDGEIYFRFYAYLPDLDQFVETRLNKGTYPIEYLQANLQTLKRHASLAHKYGLTPGMHIANPRSVPETLLERYPYLRGARVDHTFRSYRPRYTLTLAHPAVRWHYAELLRALLREVPELGFIETMLNDSGSGFEYTASLYAGRNGGPYIVREWMPDQEIARAAGENVIRYYRVLRDAAHETHPDFRMIVGLKNIAEESAVIMAGMDNGIDLQTQSQRADVADDEWAVTRRKLAARGSRLYSDTTVKGSPYVLGVPCPWQTCDRLNNLSGEDFDGVDAYIDPLSLVEHDVNREIMRAYQIGVLEAVDDAVGSTAVKWVGEDRAPSLVAIWRLSDQAVAKMPILSLYGTHGFIWGRFWVRPLVPDIDAIPEVDREYYQRFMLSVFNNPHNIDLRADALWVVHEEERCLDMIEQFDEAVLTFLDDAVDSARKAVDENPDEPSRTIFVEVRDRLLAYRCFNVTIRNVCAWIAGVHGYLGTDDDVERESKLALVREMVDSELQNTKKLLQLWETTTVDFMPIHYPAETMHAYGPNFGELLKKKIVLTEKYGDRLPRIDPNYMWRMPPEAGLDETEYLKY